MEGFIIKFQAGKMSHDLFCCQQNPYIFMVDGMCGSSRPLYTESWIYYISVSVCRGYLARRLLKELIEEKNKAAAKIQAHYRGHKERRSFKRKKYVMLSEWVGYSVTTAANWIALPVKTVFCDDSPPVAFSCHTLRRRLISFAGFFFLAITEVAELG